MRNISQWNIVILVMFILAIGTACSKSQADKDREIIEQYLSDHSLNAIEYKNTGLFYVIKKPGGSTHPDTYSIVTVNYSGYLTDGTSFDQADTLQFYLGQTITGWQLGIPLIGETGRIKLLVPSSLGYGTSAVGNIPKNSVLIFDVDLLLFN